MNYIDFRKKLVADDDFAKKFSATKSPAELVELAAKEGYIFTEDDIKNNTDLLPEELEKSAGGSWIGGPDWFIGYAAIIVGTSHND